VPRELNFKTKCFRILIYILSLPGWLPAYIIAHTFFFPLLLYFLSFVCNKKEKKSLILRILLIPFGIPISIIVGLFSGLTYQLYQNARKYFKEGKFMILIDGNIFHTFFLAI
jgi:hypothetical protein